MKEFNIIEIKENIFERNNSRASEIREQMLEKETLLINLMSSPGSGKTTTLVKTIKALQKNIGIGIIEADIDSDVDAKTIFNAGAEVVQLHTGGMCHLNADMTKQGLEALASEQMDLVVLENVGNLVCPASFDTGANKNIMILSVPEGDDKPLKYPKMFEICDVLLVNKIDTVDFFDFDMELLTRRVKKLKPDITIFPICAKTGEGMDEWYKWLRKAVSSIKKTKQNI